MVIYAVCVCVCKPDYSIIRPPVPEAHSAAKNQDPSALLGSALLSRIRLLILYLK